jgi:hypothetical protein
MATEILSARCQRPNVGSMEGSKGRLAIFEKYLSYLEPGAL